MPSPIARSISAIRILSKRRFRNTYFQRLRQRGSAAASPRRKPIRRDIMAWLISKPELGGTTHFSVIDRFGNAVACTVSVNTRFGSKLLVPNTGIVLNNEMDDFAIHPAGNVYGLVGNEANSLQPRKRPLSSMSPTIVLQGERPELWSAPRAVRGLSAPRSRRFSMCSTIECQ